MKTLSSDEQRLVNGGYRFSRIENQVMVSGVKTGMGKPDSVMPHPFGTASGSVLRQGIQRWVLSGF